MSQPFTRTFSTFVLPAALFGAAALSIVAAATPAHAVQNNGNGNGDMGSACTFVNEHRYLCTFDDGHDYICTTNYPKGPEECSPAIRKNPGRTIKAIPGLTKKAL